MVRTKADSTARKAVAAKAPRKALTSSSSSACSSSLASPKASKYGGGNVACPRPVPDWQKGISSFFGKSPHKKSSDKENDDPTELETGESSGAGCSSSQGSGDSSGTSNSSQGEATVETEDD